MIKHQHPELTVTRQCELLELPTSTYYYEKKPMSDYNRYLSTLIDEEIRASSFFRYTKNATIFSISGASC